MGNDRIEIDREEGLGSFKAMGVGVRAGVRVWVCIQRLKQEGAQPDLSEMELETEGLFQLQGKDFHIYIYIHSRLSGILRSVKSQRGPLLWKHNLMFVF